MDGMRDETGTSPADRLWLADWRRRIAELYADVRAVAATDPAEAWAMWCTERESLYRGHPQSPVPAAERASFGARHWPYDDRWRFVVGVADADATAATTALALPNSGEDALAFDRIGRVDLPLPGGTASLALFWTRGYTGGLFLPFTDAHERTRDLRRGPIRARHGEGRGPGRRSRRGHPRRRPQLRVPALVRLRPRVGVPARARRRTGSPCASRPASACPDVRREPPPRYHGRMSSVKPVVSDAVRAFLAEPNVASIATTDDDGAPRQTVAWFRLDPDDRILLNSRTPRRWPANLRRDPRVALSIIDGGDSYRWIGLTGIVDEIVDDVARAREDIVALAHRYHPEGPTERSLAAFRTQPRASFLVRVTGVHDHLEDD